MAGLYGAASKSESCGKGTEKSNGNFVLQIKGRSPGVMIL